MEKLPKEIQELMIKRHHEQHGNINVYTENPTDIAASFAWYKTIEGKDFWYQIYLGNIDHFYTMYPKNIIKPEYKVMYKKIFRKNRIESKDVDIEKLKELGLEYILNK